MYNKVEGTTSKNRSASLQLQLVLFSTHVVVRCLKAHLYTPQALLNQSAALLSRSCRSGWSVERVMTLSTPAGLLKIPVFLENSTQDWALPPPLGLQGSEEMVAQALKALPYTGVPAGAETCRRCMVVGSGGILRGKNLGPHIDQYNIIIRLVH